jgi:L-serine dehydratase
MEGGGTTDQHMFISSFELFKIGIGPSSSHTVGPMRAAGSFVEQLQTEGLLAHIGTVSVQLFGSLGATGKGHGTDKAVLGGLAGERPETVDPEQLKQHLESVRRSTRLLLAGIEEIEFDYERDFEFSGTTLPFHSNALKLAARDQAGKILLEKTYYSVGGGFVVEQSEVTDDAGNLAGPPGGVPLAVPFDFGTGGELIELCERHRLRISELMLRNEQALRTEREVRGGLLEIWQAMQACIRRGLEHADGVLPGGLGIPRRAPALYRKLQRERAASPIPLADLDWVDVWALAVCEENADGGRVVTAPTNGAAGIIPAVLQYYHRFIPGANEDGTISFLLTAAAIGSLFKKNASISGAEVGCQGEVGSACSMAAAGLAEVMGGSVRQVENAAEIGMEHHLGLTCDPIGGLVQIPCIERNAMAAVQAINAARLALGGEGRHFVSLDKVICTMRETGRDMQSKYKETAQGGLAVNVIEC